MRKAVMIVLALLAIRLLPRAFRTEARALQLLTMLIQVTAAAATMPPTSSKAKSTEHRAAALEVRVGTVTSQKGLGTTFAENVANLPSPHTSDPLVDATVVTTSGNYNGGTLSTHNHSYGHTHTTGMDSYWDAMATQFNNLITQLNAQLAQLKTAGIL